MGLVHAAFLPADRAPGRCALLEILPRRLFISRSHAIFDYPRVARMNAVQYFRAIQGDAAGCAAEADFQACGNVSVDRRLVDLLVRVVVERAPPDCRMRDLSGWRCRLNASRLEREISSAATYRAVTGGEPRIL